jgi:glutamine synthetase
MNFSYQEANHAADQVQLYKLLTRQVAAQMGLTACYLPKPVAGVNGNGMHTNLSLASKDRNLFYEKDGKEGLSPLAWDFVQRVMANAQELCLILNPSVNAYRRLDPHFEAPNQIKVSPTDRGSMIRIPLGNEKSARLEVRSVAPDTNPYLNLYGILRTGLEGPAAEPEEGSKRPRTRFLPDNIQDAIRFFKGSKFLMDALGEDVHAKYAELKVIQAERCPKALGAQVKACEIQYHHEVTNQYLWNQF